MTNKKYRFSELKRQHELPVDVNEHVASFADRLKSIDLHDRIEKIQKLKQHGRLRVYDKHQIEILNAGFRAGVCNVAEIVTVEGIPIEGPYLVVFNRTIFNPKVSFSKENGNGHEMRETEAEASVD